MLGAPRTVFRCSGIRALQVRGGDGGEKTGQNVARPPSNNGEVEFKAWLKVQRESIKEDEWLDEFMLAKLMSAKPKRRR